jgi:hypothetical protein
VLYVARGSGCFERCRVVAPVHLGGGVAFVGFVVVGLGSDKMVVVKIRYEGRKWSEPKVERRSGLCLYLMS